MEEVIVGFDDIFLYWPAFYFPRGLGIQEDVAVKNVETATQDGTFVHEIPNGPITHSFSLMYRPNDRIDVAGNKHTITTTQVEDLPLAQISTINERWDAPIRELQLKIGKKVKYYVGSDYLGEWWLKKVQVTHTTTLINNQPRGYLAGIRPVLVEIRFILMVPPEDLEDGE